MKTFWENLKKYKVLAIVFTCFLILSTIYFVLRQAGITQNVILGNESTTSFALIGILFVLFGILWVLLSPTIHPIFLLGALGVTTLGLYSTTLGGNLYYALGGILLILIAGVPFLAKKKILFIICYVVYYIIGCIFFGFLELGHFVIHVLGFGLATLSLYLPQKRFRYIFAAGSLAVPSLAFVIVAMLSMFGGHSAPTNQGYISCPFEDSVLYIQRTTEAFIDVNYDLDIYLPLQNGFYKQIGSYSTEAPLPNLTQDDFVWETIDETTYRLNFYEVEGVMQYSLDVHL